MTTVKDCENCKFSELEFNNFAGWNMLVCTNENSWSYGEYVSVKCKQYYGNSSGFKKVKVKNHE